MPSAAPQREDRERERDYYIITFNRQHIVHMQPVRLLSQRMWTVIRAIAFAANHFKFACVASGGAQRRKKEEEPKERENYLYTQNNKNTKCYIRRRRRRCEWRTFVFTLFKVCTIAMCACAFVWHTAHNSALDSPHLSQSRLHFIEFVFLSSFFFCSAIIAWITASGEERSEDQFWRATWKQSHATIPAISLHSNIYVGISNWRLVLGSILPRMVSVRLSGSCAPCVLLRRRIFVSFDSVEEIVLSTWMTFRFDLNNSLPFHDPPHNLFFYFNCIEADCAVFSWHCMHAHAHCSANTSDIVIIISLAWNCSAHCVAFVNFSVSA